MFILSINTINLLTFLFLDCYVFNPLHDQYIVSCSFIVWTPNSNISPKDVFLLIAFFLPSVQFDASSYIRCKRNLWHWKYDQHCIQLQRLFHLNQNTIPDIALNIPCNGQCKGYTGFYWHKPHKLWSPMVGSLDPDFTWVRKVCSDRTKAITRWHHACNWITQVEIYCVRLICCDYGRE